MKKIVLCITAVLCMFSVFASENELSVKFAPMAIQISTSSCEGEDPITSRYGIGAEVIYRRTLGKALFAEGGLGWNTYLLREDRPSFTNLMAFAGLGYKYQFSDLSFVAAHVDIATDTLIYDKTGSETITLKTGLDFGYSINEKIEFTLGCDGSFGFAKKNGTEYVNSRIIPMIGMNIEL